PTHRLATPAVPAAACVAEQEPELRDPRSHKHRADRRDGQLEPAQPERLDDDRRTVVAPERDPLLSEWPDAVAQLDPRREPRPAAHEDLERERLPLHARGAGRKPLDREAAGHRPRPGLREDRGEREPDAEDGERGGPDGPGRGQDGDREQPHAPGDRRAVGAGAPAHTGAAVAASASATTSVAVTPVARASGARIRRCASTGCASAWTSSGTTKSRPSVRARAFASRRSEIPERGLPPRASRRLS